MFKNLKRTFKIVVQFSIGFLVGFALITLNRLVFSSQRQRGCMLNTQGRRESLPPSHEPGTRDEDFRQDRGVPKDYPSVLRGFVKSDGDLVQDDGAGGDGPPKDEDNLQDDEDAEDSLSVFQGLVTPDDGFLQDDGATEDSLSAFQGLVTPDDDFLQQDDEATEDSRLSAFQGQANDGEASGYNSSDRGAVELKWRWGWWLDGRKGGTLMVGVMTTRQGLTHRAAAVYSTWATNPPGPVVFYIGKGGAAAGDIPNTSSLGTDAVRSEPVQMVEGLPVVELEGVRDDDYPPRAKSFAMLAHMLHNFGDRFRWFVRADDDVYVRWQKLAGFLRTMKWTRPYYVGQPGVGSRRERGKLGLHPGTPFCMGGPGVALSASALRALAPHLEGCDRVNVTLHEDTELGRCLWEHLRLHCFGRKRKMAGLFFHHYPKRLFSPTIPRSINKALTLHPLKDPEVMVKVHRYFHQRGTRDRKWHRMTAALSWVVKLKDREDKLRSEVDRARKLERVVESEFFEDKVKELMPERVGNEVDSLEDTRTELKTEVERAKELEKVREFKSLNDEVGGRRFKRAINEVDSLEDTRTEPKTELEKIKELGKVQELKSLKGDAAEHRSKRPSKGKAHAQSVWNNGILNGIPYSVRLSRMHPYQMSAMLTVANKILKSEISRHVGHPRRLQAIAQSFTRARGLQHHVVLSANNISQAFLLTTRFEGLEWREVDFVRGQSKQRGQDIGKQKRKNVKNKTGQAIGNQGIKRHERPRGRHASGNSSKASGRHRLGLSSPPSWPTLHVLLPFRGHYQAFESFLRHLATAASRYPSRVCLRVALFQSPGEQDLKPLKAAAKKSKELNISITEVDGLFSRYLALRTLAEGLPEEAVLVSADVGLLLKEFLFRVALTVAPGRSYFPVPFLRYLPRRNLPLSDFLEDAGVWRDSSFGVVALTAGDLKRTGRFGQPKTSWKEDALLCERCITKGLEVFRAPDPGLIDQRDVDADQCPGTLPDDQRQLCQQARLAFRDLLAKLAQTAEGHSGLSIESARPAINTPL